MDSNSENPYRPPAIEERWPDPPQIPDPEPHDLLRKSAIAGIVAAVVFGSGLFLACGGFGDPGLAAFGAVLATLLGLFILAGFVIFRRRLFTRRTRRRRRP